MMRLHAIRPKGRGSQLGLGECWYPRRTGKHARPLLDIPERSAPIIWLCDMLAAAAARQRANPKNREMAAP